MVTHYLDSLRNMEDASYTLKVIFSILKPQHEKVFVITWIHLKSNLAPYRIFWVGQILKLDRTWQSVNITRSSLKIFALTGC